MQRKRAVHAVVGALAVTVWISAGAAQAATSYTWVGPDSGTQQWFAGNWSPSGTPNGVGDEAVFNVPYVSGQFEVEIGSSVTLGRFVNEGTRYVKLTGSGAEQLIFATTSGNAEISLPGRGFHSDLPVVLNSDLDVNATGGTAYTAFNGVVSGDHGINFLQSTQTQNLRAHNTYTGQTYVGNANVNLGHVNGLGTTDAGTVVSDNGVLWLDVEGGTVHESLELNGRLRSFSEGTWAGGITLGDSAATINPFSNNRVITISGVIEGGQAGGELCIGEGGTSAGTTIFTAANTYLGRTAISGHDAVLQLGASGVIPDTSAVVFSYGGGTFDLQGHNEEIGGLQSWYSSSEVTLGSGTLTIGHDDSDHTFSGTIVGTGDVRKVGSGVQHFTGVQSYTGDTLVEGGFLMNSGTIVGNTYASAQGTVEGTGEFALLAFDDGGTFSPGTHDHAGSAQSTSGSWGDGGSYHWDVDSAEGTAGTDWDLWEVTGALNNEDGAILAVDGNAAGFNNTQEYSWLIAQTTDAGDLTGFDVGNVSIDTSDFDGSTGDGRFWLSVDGNGVYLEFAAGEVPSPSAAVGLLGMVLSGLALRRRRTR
jgi:autotransporter-associated beta strand protein